MTINEKGGHLESLATKCAKSYLDLSCKSKPETKSNIKRYKGESGGLGDFEYQRYKSSKERII